MKALIFSILLGLLLCGCQKKTQDLANTAEPANMPQYSEEAKEPRTY